MKLTVLGKYGPYAKGGGTATSCYLIEQENTKILLDMGAGSLTKLLAKIDIKELDAIFISHLHYDHTSDLLSFRYLLEEMGKQIKIITHFENSEWYNTLFNHPLFEIINVNNGDNLDFMGLRLSFHSLEHAVPNLAIKIEFGDKSFVYTGDTKDYDGTLRLLKGVTAAVVDCSKPEGFKGPHLSIDKGIELANVTGTFIIASHEGPDYSPLERLKDYTNIVSAKENQSYEI